MSNSRSASVVTVNGPSWKFITTDLGCASQSLIGACAEGSTTKSVSGLDAVDISSLFARSSKFRSGCFRKASFSRFRVYRESRRSENRGRARSLQSCNGRVMQSSFRRRIRAQHLHRSCLESAHNYRCRTAKQIRVVLLKRPIIGTSPLAAIAQQLLFPHAMAVGEAHRLATMLEHLWPEELSVPAVVFTHLDLMEDCAALRAKEHYTRRPDSGNDAASLFISAWLLTESGFSSNSIPVSAHSCGVNPFVETN